MSRVHIFSTIEDHGIIECQSEADPLTEISPPQELCPRVPYYTKKRCIESIKEIQNWASNLILPSNTSELAIYYYGKFEEKKNGKTGRYNKNGYLGAILYIACQADKNPRTFKGNYQNSSFDIFSLAIAKAYGNPKISDQEIKHCYNQLRKFLDLKRDSAFVNSVGSAPADFIVCH